jgi:hypothetical protein
VFRRTSGQATRFELICWRRGRRFSLSGAVATPVFPRILLSGAVTTDAAGKAVVTDLPVGFDLSYTVQSLVTAEDRSATRGSIGLTKAGEVAEVIVTLPGVGRVTGVVTLGDGVAVVAAVPVRLHSQSVALGGAMQTQLSGADGSFAFTGGGCTTLPAQRIWVPCLVAGEIAPMAS